MKALCRARRFRSSARVVSDFMSYACGHSSLAVVSHLALQARCPVVLRGAASVLQPLFEAVKSERFETVRWLLDHGVDPGVLDMAENNALFMARSPQMIRYLLACGVDPSHTNKLMETPLEHACASGNIDCISCYLEDSRVDPNALSPRRGNTLGHELMDMLAKRIRGYANSEARLEAQHIVDLLCSGRFKTDTLTEKGAPFGASLAHALSLEESSLQSCWVEGKPMSDLQKTEHIGWRRDILLRLEGASIDINGFISPAAEAALHENPDLLYKYLLSPRPFPNAIGQKQPRTALFLWEHGYRAQLFRALEACPVPAGPLSLAAEVLLDPLKRLLQGTTDTAASGDSRELLGIFEECYARMRELDLLHVRVSMWGQTIFRLLLGCYGACVSEHSPILTAHLKELLEDRRTLQEHETEPRAPASPSRENPGPSQLKEDRAYRLFAPLRATDISRLVQAELALRKEAMEGQEQEKAQRQPPKRPPSEKNIFYSICACNLSRAKLSWLLSEMCRVHGTSPEGRSELRALLMESTSETLSPLEFMSQHSHFDFFEVVHIEHGLVSLRDCISMGERTKMPFIHALCSARTSQALQLVLDASDEDRRLLLDSRDLQGRTLVHLLCSLVGANPNMYEKILEDFLDKLEAHPEGPELVRALLDTRDDLGITPTHIALSFFRDGSYKGRLAPPFLRASIGQRDRLGRTPLHYLFQQLPSTDETSWQALLTGLERLESARAPDEVRRRIEKLGGLCLGQPQHCDPALVSSIIRGAYDEAFCESLVSRDLFGMTPLFYALRAQAIFTFTLMSRLVQGRPVQPLSVGGVEVYPLAQLNDARSCSGKTLLLTALETGNESLIQTTILLGGKAMDTVQLGETNAAPERPLGWARTHKAVDRLNEVYLPRSALMEVFERNMSGVALLMIDSCSPRYVLASAILTGNTGFSGYILENRDDNLGALVEGCETEGLCLSHILFMSTQLPLSAMLSIYQALVRRGISFDARTPQGQTPLHFAARQGLESLKRALSCLASDHEMDALIDALNTRDNSGASPLTILLLDSMTHKLPTHTGFSGPKNEKDLKREARAVLSKFPRYMAHALETSREYWFVLRLQLFVSELRAAAHSMHFNSGLAAVQSHLGTLFKGAPIPGSLFRNHRPDDVLELREVGTAGGVYIGTLLLELVQSCNVPVLMDYLLALDRDAFARVDRALAVRASTGMSVFLAAAHTRSLQMLVLLLVLAKFVQTPLDISGRLQGKHGPKPFVHALLRPDAHALEGECPFLHVVLGALEEGRAVGGAGAFSATPDGSDVEYLYRVPGLLEQVQRLGGLAALPPRSTHGPFSPTPLLQPLSVPERAQVAALSLAFHRRLLAHVHAVGGEEVLGGTHHAFYSGSNERYASYEAADKPVPLHAYGVKSVVAVARSGCLNSFYDLSVICNARSLHTSGTVYLVKRNYGTLDGSYSNSTSTNYADFQEALAAFRKLFTAKFGGEWEDTVRDPKAFSREKHPGCYRLLVQEERDSKEDSELAHFSSLIGALAKDSAEIFLNSVISICDKALDAAPGPQDQALACAVLDSFYKGQGFAPSRLSAPQQQLLAKICRDALRESDIFRNPGWRQETRRFCPQVGRVGCNFDIPEADIEQARHLLLEVRAQLPAYEQLHKAITSNTLTRGETEKLLERLHTVQEQLALLTARLTVLVPPTSDSVAPSILDSPEKVDEEERRLDDLSKVNELSSIVFAALEQALAGGLNPLDFIYEHMRVSLECVQRPTGKTRPGSMSEFEVVNAYVGGQALAIWRIEDSAPYQPAQEHRYLLHGTRSPNVMGILSMGLQVAPDAAWNTGKRLGFGVYLSDNIRKARHYTSSRVSMSPFWSFVFVVEASYDRLCELWDVRDFAVRSPTLGPVEGTDATLLHGTFEPTAAALYYDGASVPFPVGEFRPSSRPQGEANSEYCIYDARRLKLRYLVVLPH